MWAGVKKQIDNSVWTSEPIMEWITAGRNLVSPSAAPALSLCSGCEEAVVNVIGQVKALLRAIPLLQAGFQFLQVGMA